MNSQNTGLQLITNQGRECKGKTRYRNELSVRHIESTTVRCVIKFEVLQRNTILKTYFIPQALTRQFSSYKYVSITPKYEASSNKYNSMDDKGFLTIF